MVLQKICHCHAEKDLYYQQPESSLVPGTTGCSTRACKYLRKLRSSSDTVREDLGIFSPIFPSHPSPTCAFPESSQLLTLPAPTGLLQTAVTCTGPFDKIPVLTTAVWHLCYQPGMHHGLCKDRSMWKDSSKAGLNFQLTNDIVEALFKTDPQSQPLQ